MNRPLSNPVDGSARSEPVLDISGLTVGYQDGDQVRVAVHEIDFKVAAGEVVALVGESGSGKTSSAQAIIGLLADNGRIISGTIRLNGTDVTALAAKKKSASTRSVARL